MYHQHAFISLLCDWLLVYCFRGRGKRTQITVSKINVMNVLRFHGRFNNECYQDRFMAPPYFKQIRYRMLTNGCWTELFSHFHS